MPKIHKLRAACLAGLAGFALHNIALADSTTSSELPRVAVGAELGTAGIGPAAIFTINPKVSITVAYTWLDFDYDVDSRRGSYNGDIKLSNLQALVDWHPWGGMLHFSGGLFVSNNSIDVTSKPKSGYLYEIGDNTYTGAQIGSVTGTADIGNSVAPFFGVGWNKLPTGRGWGFFSTIGLLFAGSSEVHLTAKGPMANDPAFQNDLRKEEQSINNDLDDFKAQPVAQIGVLYRF